MSSAEDFRRFERESSAFLSCVSIDACLDAAHESIAAWHPTGFVVFYLPLSFGGDCVRLHIWPRGARLAEQGHPEVHSHYWHLHALVIAGAYHDELIEVRSDPRGHLEFYDIEYLDQLTARVTPSGERASTAVVGDRIAIAAESHVLEAGSFHRTRVGTSETAATLMVVSAPVTGARLVGQPGVLGGVRSRRVLTELDSKRLLAEVTPS